MAEEIRPTLREFLEQRIDALERNIDHRFDGLQRERNLLVETNRAAIDKTEDAVSRRLEAVDELREDLSEWRTNTMSRQEVEARFHAIDEKIELRFGDLDRKLDQLNDSVTLTTGRSSGIDAGRAFLFALVTAVAAIIGVIILLTR